jgi:hypothetical protein
VRYTENKVCRHVGLDGQALEQTRRNFFILPVGCVLMFMVMPYLYALCPLGVIIRANYISFIRGNNVGQFAQLSFARHSLLLLFSDVALLPGDFSVIS